VGDQLLLKLQALFTLAKQVKLNEVVNRTKPFPSVSGLCPNVPSYVN